MTDQTFPPFDLPKTETPKKRRGPKPGAKKRAKSVFEQGINQRHTKESIAKLEPAVTKIHDNNVLLSIVAVLDALDRHVARDVVKVLARIYA